MSHVVSLTNITEVIEGAFSRAVVDLTTLREESESVKLLKDRVARLVDGHDDDSVTRLTESAGEKTFELASLSHIN